MNHETRMHYVQTPVATKTALNKMKFRRLMISCLRVLNSIIHGLMPYNERNRKIGIVRSCKMSYICHGEACLEWTFIKENDVASHWAIIFRPTTAGPRDWGEAVQCTEGA